jgi:hypothetical protein
MFEGKPEVRRKIRRGKVWWLEEREMIYERWEWRGGANRQILENNWHLSRWRPKLLNDCR